MNAKKRRTMNNPIIDIYIDNENQLYNMYNHNKISPKLSDYLDREVEKLSIQSNITLKIYMDNLTEEKEEEISALIREHYGLIISEKQFQRKEDFLKRIIIIIIGIFLLFISFNIPTKSYTALNELFSIASWLIIWDTAEVIIFEDSREINIEKRAKQIVTSKIAFLPLNKKN